MRKGLIAAVLVLAACTKPAPAPEPAASPTASFTSEPAPSETASAAPDEASPAAATPAAKPDKHLQALGTEPFWSVDVLPHARLRYATPDMANGVIVSAVERKRGNALRYTGRLNRHVFQLDVVPATCSDGMSDTVYPYKATLLHSGRTDHGCARMK